ncbi:response regulator transcription factor [Helcobacillus massiliensis]|uniref:DNA-binding NarL/FixJ family response regulator n=1 Tax=Helcobacillus massiliensis TaxID=521392 RepID=A0A839QNW7_9MICO|nr:MULTISPECIES: response regulator transcription factor [Helcobacillus]MBB3022183.1 DNA-binding NarL/FixJ family response regulator [Helcobacillus massiliensis]MCG7426747.1 response regulator transcription factor [Helcobacillus sp. ACRRO]MCT1557285.1 response regulator transcription factor [Helcobacillus massiliensis]MCT2036236.1 response regulator transcription factor [Helcobacillus massiliensis]MCT2331570.1 response regulator transcription factor [Helcobacillus massiliensis]
MDQQTRVMIVDDHEVVRRGIVAAIDADERLTVVAEAGSVAEAQRRLPAVRPDLLVVDLQLPDGTGIDVMNIARSLREDQPMLVLTSFNDTAAIRESRQAGARGLLMKSARSAEITGAIVEVAAGGTMWPAGKDDGDEFDLTPVESRIVQFIGDGLPNREIAEHLGIAEKTVKNRITGILQKMGMQRRTQVAAWVVANRRADWKDS